MVNPGYYATLMAFGEANSGTVSAMTNMCGNVGAASFPIVVPWLIAHAGGWDAVLVGFGTIYIVAAMLWARVKA